MDIKKYLFVIFIIIIILFPFSFSKKEIVIKHKINLPKITLKDSDFKIYNKQLEKTGTFSYLELFNDKKYIIYNLNTKFIEENNTFIAKRVLFNKLYRFWDATYITKDYTYITKSGIYNPKNKKITAYNFKFFNKEIDGEGSKMIYLNNQIYADNIKYILKGFK